MNIFTYFYQFNPLNNYKIIHLQIIKSTILINKTKNLTFKRTQLLSNHKINLRLQIMLLYYRLKCQC